MRFPRFTPVRGSLPAVWLMLLACGAQREPGDATWTMRPDGFGPLTAGMRVEDAAEVVPGAFRVPVGTMPTACTYAAWDSAPSGVRVMLEDGAVTRIDVTEGGAVATAEGARIGDSESRIDSLYAGRVTRRPHKYTEGRYLIVRDRPDSLAADVPIAATETGAVPPNSRRDFRLVFETDGSRVTRYRAGLFPSVEYVEGCA